MSAEQIFSIANLMTMVCWILLAIVPGRRWVTDIVTGRAVPALFAVGYTAIVVAVFPRATGSFSTLAGVAALFGNPWLLLAGWLHYLAFDLLIGTWEARDSADQAAEKDRLQRRQCAEHALLGDDAAGVRHRGCGRRRAGV